MDFENSVLKEIRTTVEEVDPIEWLRTLAESESGYAGPGGSTPPLSNVQKQKSNPPSNRASFHQGLSKEDDWASVEALMGTLDEINKLANS